MTEKKHVKSEKVCAKGKFSYFSAKLLSSSLKNTHFMVKHRYDIAIFDLSLFDS